jgi:hypothetical protein
MKEFIAVKSVIAKIKGFDGDRVGFLRAQVYAQEDVLMVVDQREVVGGVCCVDQAEGERGVVLKDGDMIRIK